MDASNTSRGGWLLAMGLGAAAAWASAGLAADVEPGRLTVKVDQPGVKISPMHFGLMTEEINHSYDGGLYAELIRNRTFKDDPKTPATGRWSPGRRRRDHRAGRRRPGERHGPDDQPAAGHRHGWPGAARGVANEGYWGIPVTPNTQYRASFYARAGGGFDGPLTVAIESNDGKTTAASAAFPRLDAKWKKYTARSRRGT